MPHQLPKGVQDDLASLLPALSELGYEPVESQYSPWSFGGDYFVDFTGYYSTVFAPFQKQIVKEEETAAVNAQEEEKISILKASQNQKPGSSVGELAPRRFTSTVGDTKAKHTRIELICNSCTVDFK